MEIASSSIQMRATHASLTATRVTERLDVWSGRNADQATPPQSQTSAVSLSQRGLAAADTDQIGGQTEEDSLDPKLRLMASMIAMITGKPVRLLRMADFTAAGESKPTATNAPQQSAAPAPGPGFEYSLTATRMEYEATRFEAQGVIETRDGQQIRFKVGFEMERSYFESLNMEVRGGQARLKDPLVLDFGGAAAALQDARFEFDLTADGQLESLPMLGSGRGFLAIDRNGNGRIDNGRELFGPTTGDGFAELAALDADGNGWIDAADPGFAMLGLWMPEENGEGRLTTLTEAGVGALYLSRVGTPFELRNQANETLGVMRASSIYLAQDGQVGTVSQIDLAV